MTLLDVTTLLFSTLVMATLARRDALPYVLVVVAGVVSLHSNPSAIDYLNVLMFGGGVWLVAVRVLRGMYG